MRPRLLWKLLGVNLPVLAVVGLGIWIAIDTLAAGYFSALMLRYGISPVESNRMFLEAVHRYLLWATLAAAGVAVGLSFLLTRRVLGPLSQMTEVAGRLAAGDFSSRVTETSVDEVGALGAAFNRMAESLARLESLRKSMVADVAHELRTPLTNVRGYLEALADGVVPPSRETFELLLGETQRLASLVEGLLELAKADAARAFLERRPVSLHELLGQQLEIHRPRFQARALRLAARLAPDADAVTADRDRLSQVLGNLLDNALRYATPGSEVEVTAERVPEGVRVTVSNTGEEIDERDLPLLFERFFRVDRSRSREAGGAGLGLAIARELVEAHGGRAGASSAAGRTSVWFTLPG
ncbi:MAG: HAMP domain-containing protein [Deltaproteobacteria bacterium]|nr:HAMP domain-containing protein [Deltaproteobacteria bacterium]